MIAHLVSNQLHLVPTCALQASRKVCGNSVVLMCIHTHRYCRTCPRAARRRL